MYACICVCVSPRVHSVNTVSYKPSVCLYVSVCLSLSLTLSIGVVVDQHTRPQVHARLHSLVTPSRVRRSSFQSASRCSPRSLVEDGHVLLCCELAGITHRYWHVENVCFTACDPESAATSGQHFTKLWLMIDDVVEETDDLIRF